jgi:hypothetical protein
MSNKNKSIISLILFCFSACSPIAPRPSTSGLDYPNVGIPNVHQEIYDRTLDASTQVSDAAVTFNYPEGSRIVGLFRGDAAPFNGVLFNTIAAAATVEVPRRELNVCRTRSIIDQQRLTEIALTDIENLRGSINAHRQAYNTFITNRNNTIQQYETYTTSLRTRVETERYRLIGFTVGGFVVGAATVGLIVGLLPRVSP